MKCDYAIANVRDFWRWLLQFDLPDTTEANSCQKDVKKLSQTNTWYNVVILSRLNSVVLDCLIVTLIIPIHIIIIVF